MFSFGPGRIEPRHTLLGKIGLAGIEPAASPTPRVRDTTSPQPDFTRESYFSSLPSKKQILNLGKASIKKLCFFSAWAAFAAR